MAILRLQGLTCSIVLTLAASPCFAEVNLPQGTAHSAVETPLDGLSFDELLGDSHALGDIALFDKQSADLWKKYSAAIRQDSERVEAHESRSIKDGDKTMRFSLTTKGEKPANGYPLYIALHGGGGTAASINDSQWDHMKIYYLDGVSSGKYVATRGVTNTWNLHFVDESYRLYDYLIENMIALEDVDPNRVYILGFSAGGDGVYQIAPRMPDRFAAANMSAGHHNWVKFDNLFQTPFLIQVGQFDSAYKRNTVAVENHIELNRLQSLRGGYIHDAFVHYRGSHNSWADEDPSGRPQTILADPIGWLKNGSEATTKKNTNAIHWLDQYTRKPYPNKLVWDPQTNAPRSVNKGSGYILDAKLKERIGQPRELFYWLDISQAKSLPDSITIEASYDSEANAVRLKSLAKLDAIRVLVHPSMLDFDREVAVYVDDQLVERIALRADLQIMTRTLLERGDANYIFPAEINLKQAEDGSWTAVE